jgi:hypothetical protein
MFLSAAHDAESHILYLRFRSGDVYQYFEFPADQYHEFLKAESHGRYFLSYIRDHFRFERLARLRIA